MALRKPYLDPSHKIIFPNVNASSRALPKSITTSVVSKPVELDYDRNALLISDPQLLRIRFVDVALVAKPGDLLTLVIRHFPHKLLNNLGRLINPVWPKPVSKVATQAQKAEAQARAQTNYQFTMGNADIEVFLEIAHFAGSPVPGTGSDALTLALFVTPQGTAPGLFQDEALDSNASARGSVQVAKLRFLSILQPIERLFLCDLVDVTRVGTRPTTQDLEQALRIARMEKLLHKVPEDVVSAQDRWLRNPFQVGICEDEDDQRQKLHMVVHMPPFRSKALTDFTDRYFPSVGIGVMRDFQNREFVVQDLQRESHTLSIQDSLLIHEAFDLVERFWSSSWFFLSKILNSVTDTAFTPKDIWGQIHDSPALMKKVTDEFVASDKTEILLVLQHDYLKHMYARLREVFAEIFSVSALVRITLTGSQPKELEVEVHEFEIVRLRETLGSVFDGINNGGNIAVVPPASGGPGGRLVVGGSKDRRMDASLLEFLRRQTPEGVLEIDTSWLARGRVYEMIAFVPAPKRKRKWVVLRNAPDLALNILLEAARYYFHDKTLEIDGGDWTAGSDLLGTVDSERFVSELFRGKFWRCPFDLEEEPFPMDEPPRMFQLSTKPSSPPTEKPIKKEVHFFPANISLLQILQLENTKQRWNRNFADKIKKLTSELVKQLDPRDRPEIVPLPALFDIPSIDTGRTGAFVPNMIDLVVSDWELFVPRPFGPRMKVDDAVEVLKKVMKRELHGNLTADFAGKQGLKTHTQWITAVPGSNIETLSISDIARCYPDTPDDFEQALLNKNRTEFTAAGLLRKKKWHQLTIPEETVDLFEFYTTVLLTDLGLRVHWIDTWTYHCLYGGLHGATNCIREP